MRLKNLLILCISLFLSNFGIAEDTKHGVVYHIAEESQAMRALHNAQNHLAADENVKITFVVLSGGIHFLISDAADEKGRLYGPYIDELSMKGVKFKACKNTMRALNLSLDDLNFGVEEVKSGVFEVARLQYEEGYAYIRP
jgi:intracellular sulfur oxidation DsrE/DsrF family protein